MTGMAVSLSIDAGCWAELPRNAGVYIFRGEGRLPLYIGKSVDIRARVMSHARAPDEASMMAQTKQVDVIETAGEIGALLLESRLIKTESPLFNQRLRRIRSLCAIQLKATAQGQVPTIVDGRSVHLGAAPGLYGLFSSRRAAVEKLKALAQQHRLCLAALGLEKASSRGCFGLQIKACSGSCVGLEDRHVHDQRLLSALVDSQVEVWPFHGPVDLVEEAGGWVQRHRVNNWCYLGTWCSKAGVMHHTAEFKPHDFDLDSYKILVKPIMRQTVRLEAVIP